MSSKTRLSRIFGGGTATASAGAATLNATAGLITSESVTTAAGATYTLTLPHNQIAATDLVFASVTTAGTGTPAVTKVTPAGGSLVIVVQNIHASAAFNNTLKIAFLAVGQA
jgi:hypothetical protein